MKVFIVHAHPEPNSFSGAMTKAATDALIGAGHKVTVSDLYAMQYNPVSDRRNFKSVKSADYYKQQVEETYASENNTFADDVQGEIDKLEWCDTLIFQFPLWWFGLPGIMKGWVDKVFVMGKVYGYGKMYETGRFRGKRGLCALTTGGAREHYVPDSHTGDMNAVLMPIQVGMMQFTGMDVMPPYVVYQPAHISEEERKEHLVSYADHVLKIPTMQPLLQFDPVRL